MTGGDRGIRGVADHAVKCLERAPTRGQRRIDGDGVNVRGDRRRRIPQGDAAVPALLVEAAEAGVPLREIIQGGQGAGEIVETTTADGQHVQNVPIPRHLACQPFSRCLSLREFTVLQQSADPMDVSFHGRCTRCTEGRWWIVWCRLNHR